MEDIVEARASRRFLWVTLEDCGEQDNLVLHKEEYNFREVNFEAKEFQIQ